MVSGRRDHAIDHGFYQWLLQRPSNNVWLYIGGLRPNRRDGESYTCCAYGFRLRSVDVLRRRKRGIDIQCDIRQYLVSRGGYDTGHYRHHIWILHSHPNCFWLCFSSLGTRGGHCHPCTCRTRDHAERPNDLLRRRKRELDIECLNGQYLVSRRRHNPNDCGYNFWNLYGHADHFGLYFGTFGTCDRHRECCSCNAYHFRFWPHDFLFGWLRDPDQQQCLGQPLVPWKSDDTVDYGDRFR